jgi:starch-binding outer membrane protein, SusD/RagB family
MINNTYSFVKNQRYRKMMLIGGLILSTIFSCDNFLNIDEPKTKVTKLVVFSNDVTASSAMTGIYLDMQDIEGFASGSEKSVLALSGLSSDELVDFSRTNMVNIDFENNNLKEDNAYLVALWKSIYQILYECNSVLEGLEGSDGITAETKNHLKGEAFFVRAFTNLQLANLFGDAPMVVTTNYENNATLPRVSKALIYTSIVNDLNLAKSLLPESYPTLEDDFVTPARTRPNSFAASALLARVYLYNQQWEQAEQESSNVIAASELYTLLEDLNSVFLKSSKEAIWQIYPRTADGIGYTNEAYFFVNFAPSYNVLNQELVNSFSINDLRLVNWIQEADGAFYPFKYKQALAGALSEYSTPLRLAEQHLIRAEARAHQNKLVDGIADLDRIRDRAGLLLYNDTDPLMDQEELLLAIEMERRWELFTEGHRWFDLKRSNRAVDVLGQVKESFSVNDQLYPIPVGEFQKNPALGKQNPGY